MKIGILTHDSNALSHRRFTAAALKRQQEIVFIHTSYCYMNISSTSPAIYYRNNEQFHDIAAIIPRITPNHTFYGTAVLRQFELMGVYALNSALSITWARDKLRAIQLLARKHVPLPITGFADSPEETEKLIDVVKGAPLIIRLSEGPEGRGTIFAETPQAAVSVINAFKQLKTNILVQECIQEANGIDLRVIIVGKKVLGAFQRKRIDSGNRSHASSRISIVELSLQEKKIALRATKALKLNFATVDLIRSNRGPLVLDVDCSPKIEMLEKLTQIDIMDAIIQFIVETVKQPD